MTIRFTCKECSSVLKIKDELAGTKGRCPKCKTEFVVPEASLESSGSRAVGTISIKTGATQADVTTSRTDENSVSQTGNESQRSSTVKGDDCGFKSDSNADQLVVEKVIAQSGSDSGSTADDELDAPLSNSISTVASSVADSADDVAQPSQLNGESDHLESHRHSLGFDDDDDLDSPPVLAGSDVIVPQVEPKSLSSSKKLEKNRRPIPDSFAKSDRLESKKDKPSKGKAADEPFDPLAFLMSDANDPNRSKFPAIPSGDSDLSLSDDSDYDLMNRPTPSPVKVPVPKALVARPTPEKVDLASAAKMMKKAIKDAQSDAVRQRQLDSKPGFDFGLIFREIGFRGLIILSCLVVGVLISITLGNYVFSSTLKTPPLAKVRGTITLDGQPISNATIYFAPKDLSVPGTRRDRARTAIGVSDEKGSFKMMYSPADKIEGVAKGKSRVWVTHFGPKGDDTPVSWTEAGFREIDIPTDKSSVPLDIKMESDPHRK